MLLKQQYESQDICKEAEAFAATCVVFKIKTTELAFASGLDRSVIERFKLGFSDINTGVLIKILKVLTPNERNFYNSLMAIQGAVDDAGITMPLLDFAASSSPNIYRDALEMTFKVFNINSKDVYSVAGLQSSNFSNWFTGKRDINLPNLAKIKSALTKEQRTFFENVADIFIYMELRQPIENNDVAILNNQQLFDLTA